MTVYILICFVVLNIKSILPLQVAKRPKRSVEQDTAFLKIHRINKIIIFQYYNKRVMEMFNLRTKCVLRN